MLLRVASAVLLIGVVTGCGSQTDDSGPVSKPEATATLEFTNFGCSAVAKYRLAAFRANTPEEAAASAVPDVTRWETTLHKRRASARGYFEDSDSYEVSVTLLIDELGQWTARKICRSDQ